MPALHGLITGVAGHLSHVSIQAKDRFGNNRTYGGDYFSVRLTGVSPMTSVSAKDTTCLSGSVTEEIRLKTLKHEGWIHTLPHVHECIVSIGQSITNNEESKTTTTDLIDEDGDVIVPSGMIQTASEGWNSEGDDATYNGSYIPYVAGTFQLDILLNGTVLVHDSPYSLVVVPDTTNGSTR